MQLGMALGAGAKAATDTYHDMEAEKRAKKAEKRLDDADTRHQNMRTGVSGWMAANLGGPATTPVPAPGDGATAPTDAPAAGMPMAAPAPDIAAPAAGPALAAPARPPMDMTHSIALATGPKPAIAGNLDPYNRPIVKNPDGSYSTTQSISIGTDKGETVIPTVFDGAHHTNAEAAARYAQTGEHLGIFPAGATDAADQYATALHNDQDAYVQAHGGPDKFTPAAAAAAAPTHADGAKPDPLGVMRRADAAGQQITPDAWGQLAQIVAQNADDPASAMPYIQRYQEEKAKAIASNILLLSQSGDINGLQDFLPKGATLTQNADGTVTLGTGKGKGKTYDTIGDFGNEWAIAALGDPKATVDFAQSNTGTAFQRRQQALETTVAQHNMKWDDILKPLQAQLTQAQITHTNRETQHIGFGEALSTRAEARRGAGAGGDAPTYGGLDKHQTKAVETAMGAASKYAQAQVKDLPSTDPGYAAAVRNATNAYLTNFTTPAQKAALNVLNTQAQAAAAAAAPPARGMDMAAGRPATSADMAGIARPPGAAPAPHPAPRQPIDPRLTQPMLPGAAAVVRGFGDRVGASWRKDLSGGRR